MIHDAALEGVPCQRVAQPYVGGDTTSPGWDGYVLAWGGGGVCASNSAVLFTGGSDGIEASHSFREIGKNGRRSTRDTGSVNTGYRLV